LLQFISLHSNLALLVSSISYLRTLWRYTNAVIIIIIFFPKTDPPQLFTVRLVQHCAAILTTDELLLTNCSE